MSTKGLEPNLQSVILFRHSFEAYGNYLTILLACSQEGVSCKEANEVEIIRLYNFRTQIANYLVYLFIMLSDQTDNHRLFPLSYIEIQISEEKLSVIWF